MLGSTNIEHGTRNIVMVGNNDLRQGMGQGAGVDWESSAENLSSKTLDFSQASKTADDNIPSKMGLAANPGMPSDGQSMALTVDSAEAGYGQNKVLTCILRGMENLVFYRFFFMI